MTSENRRPQVVVIGGGFGGLAAARALRGSPCDVILIDISPEHVFQPLLYQCATGILSEGQITAPLRKLMAGHRNVTTLAAEMTGIDPARRRITCSRGDDLGEFEVGYDHLIVAAGMRQSYFGHDEFAQWAPGMKTIGDALSIRRRVFGAFELAETATDPAERDRWLTFAVVGAGPTGVELAGQIRELATKTLCDEFRRADPAEARVLLFEGVDMPLATFGKKLAAVAARELKQLGVELHMNTMVTGVDENGLTVKDKAGTQTRHEAGTVLWTAGVEAPPVARAVAQATGAEQDRSGRITVQDDLTIPGYPEISVIGDMMKLRKLPGVAEVAMQAGRYAGRRITRLLSGQPAGGPFRYLDAGSAAYISRGRAVLSAGPVRMTGFAGWWAWLFIHIAFLTGFRNRLGAILTWWTTFTRDLRRERAYPSHAPGRGPAAGQDRMPPPAMAAPRPRQPAAPAPARHGQIV